ncbi:hypothetical protein HJG60_010261 [Phyllostomus discolor]|uniref:Uncharacterized protein n=1 Tax=Phyllostomus discolor TaxID=89673 RepID=A0A834AZ18_9CHIR|nr:hypothetical protein HJG60_010261 [Phyllostomus discolor]
MRQLQQKAGGKGVCAGIRLCVKCKILTSVNKIKLCLTVPCLLPVGPVLTTLHSQLAAMPLRSLNHSSEESKVESSHKTCTFCDHILPKWAILPWPSGSVGWSISKMLHTPSPVGHIPRVRVQCPIGAHMGGN